MSPEVSQAAQEAFGIGPNGPVEERGNDEQESNVMLFPVPEIGQEDYDEPEEDPRIVQLLENQATQQAQMTELMRMLANQSAPAQAQAQVAPINFTEGYDPTALIEQFTEDPNQAVMNLPIMRQMAKIISDQGEALRSFNARFTEADYYEQQGVTDPSQKELHRRAMALGQKDPTALLALATKQLALETAEKAKAAEGLRTGRGKVRGQGRIQTQQEKAQQLLNDPFDQNNKMRALINRLAK